MPALQIETSPEKESMRSGKFSEAHRDLDANGFAVVVDVATPQDLAVIRAGWQRVLNRNGVAIRELGERSSGAPQIQEVQHITAHAPEIIETEFFKNAKAFSEAYLKSRVHLKFDHVIYKPPLSNRETGWHQDSTYAPRFWRFLRRVHWWLPLNDVSIEQGCMQYVPGTQHSARMKHVPVGPTSDAVKTILPDGAKVIACPVKAGSACCHLPKTLHCAGPNTTNLPREAFILQFVAPTLIPRFDF